MRIILALLALALVLNNVVVGLVTIAVKALL